MYGIRGVLYNWIKDYLTNRQQYVSLQDVCSSSLCVTCGVPQGSVLGPLLFSERELTFTFAICCRPSVCLSVVCLSSVVCGR